MDDWRIEARNDARASKAIRDEQIPPELTPKIPKPKRFSPTMDTFNATTEYVNSLDARDNALEAQMAKISTNAIQDKLGWKPSTIKTDVTKEMILDYQQEMRKPIEIDGVKYNYHPSSIDIDKVEYGPPIAEELTPREIRDLEDEKNFLLQQLQYYQEEVLRFEREVKPARRLDYDEQKSILVQRNRTLQILQLDVDFDDEMGRIDARIQNLNDAITDNEVQLDQINFRIISNDRNKRMNQADRLRVDKENVQRLKAYKEDLNLLNKGRLNVEQQPNESEDEFRTRLRDTGMMTYDEDAMSKSAELYNREKMKERMMEIHRDTVMTGNALKSFDADQLFEMNKNWSKLKQNFIKIYGFNSPAVRDRDIVDFFTSTINPVVDAKNSGVLLAEEERLLEPTPYRTEVLSPVKLAAGEEPAKASKSTVQSMTLAEQDSYAQSFGVDVSGYRTKQEKLDAIEKAGLIKRKVRVVEVDPQAEVFYEAQATAGEGLKPISHNLPSKIEFGKITISPKKLYYDNVLAIHHKSGKAFNGVPNTTVSDKFVSIIMNLLKGQKPSLKDFSTLDINEKGIYDSLIYMAGLQKEVDNTFHDTKNNLKNRLELLEGEIGAGNNNPKLKKELLYLLSKMVKTGMVGGGDARRYYQSVCK